MEVRRQPLTFDHLRSPATSAPRKTGSSRFPSLGSHPLFDGVPEADRARLEGASQTRSFSKGQMVFLPGDPAHRIYIVVSGRVKLARLSDSGKELILDLLEPGTLFGEASVIDASQRENMAEAVEPTVLWTLPAAGFRTLMSRNPRVLEAIMKLMQVRHRNLERRLLDVVHKNAPGRLAHLLLDLAKRYGVPDARGTMLRIKLSQTTLGNWLGVSREIVNHTISDLKRRGAIEVAEGRIIIRDLDELATRAA